MGSHKNTKYITNLLVLACGMSEFVYDVIKLSEAETKLKYYTFKTFAILVRNIFFFYIFY